VCKEGSQEDVVAGDESRIVAGIRTFWALYTTLSNLKFLLRVMRNFFLFFN
jgi:hypothetical protein